MKQEFEMTRQEMDNIIAINKGGGDPVMFLSGGTPMGNSLQEKINQYWKILADKYGFEPMSVEGSSKGELFFIATPRKNKKQIQYEFCEKVKNEISDLELQLQEANKRLDDGQINLCNDCQNEFATCNSNPIFGNGRGNDNVIECNIYSQIEPF